MHREIHRGGTEGGDKCVDNVDKLRKKWWGGEKGTNPEEVCNTTGRQRGQGNFELAANFGYSSRGSADPRESLRKRRISKLALTAHKVLPLHTHREPDADFGRCPSV